MKPRNEEAHNDSDSDEDKENQSGADAEDDPLKKYYASNGGSSSKGEPLKVEDLTGGAVKKALEVPEYHAQFYWKTNPNALVSEDIDELLKDYQ